jgi:hypothetical protein
LRCSKVESTRIGELGEYKINIQLNQLPKDCKYLIIYDVELTKFIGRKLIRLSTENPEPFLKSEDIIHINNLLVKANILDPKIRDEHVDKAKGKKQEIVN